MNHKHSKQIKEAIESTEKVLKTADGKAAAAKKLEEALEEKIIRLDRFLDRQLFILAEELQAQINGANETEK